MGVTRQGAEVAQALDGLLRVGRLKRGRRGGTVRPAVTGLCQAVDGGLLGADGAAGGIGSLGGGLGLGSEVIGLRLLGGEVILELLDFLVLRGDLLGDLTDLVDERLHISILRRLHRLFGRQLLRDSRDGGGSESNTDQRQVDAVRKTHGRTPQKLQVNTPTIEELKDNLSIVIRKRKNPISTRVETG